MTVGMFLQMPITYTVIGEVTDDKAFSYGDAVIGLDEAEEAWTGTLEKVFATRSAAPGMSPGRCPRRLSKGAPP